MKIFYTLVIFSLIAGSSYSHDANDHQKIDHEIEHNQDLGYIDSFSNQLKNCKAPDENEKFDWPYKLESIGHSMASYQNYGGSPYFHHGLDIRGPDGTDVIATFRGQVVNIENYGSGPLYWEVALIDPNGCLWQYHHVKKESIPQKIHDAYSAWKKDKTKGFVEKGTLVGKIITWPVNTFGEYFHHVHLNILDHNKKYLNPYSFMKNLNDKVGPKINQIGIIKNKRKTPGNEVSGDYTLYVDSTDLVLHDKFILPPYSLHYYFNDKPEKKYTVWQFDSLPGGSSNKKDVETFYVSGRSDLTCGNYQCRRVIIDLGYTHKLPKEKGTYEITVEAKDFSGNSAKKSYKWTVK